MCSYFCWCISDGHQLIIQPATIQLHTKVLVHTLGLYQTQCTLVSICAFVDWNCCGDRGDSYICTPALSQQIALLCICVRLFEFVFRQCCTWMYLDAVEGFPVLQNLKKVSWLDTWYNANGTVVFEGCCDSLYGFDFTLKLVLGSCSLFNNTNLFPRTIAWWVGAVVT